MNCTYCGNEMEAGNLKTEGAPGLFYLPAGENYSIFSTQKGIESKGGIVLDGPYKTRLHYTSVGCYVCKSCRKIVVSY